MRRMTPEQHAARGAKHSASLKESWRRRKMVDNHRIVAIEECGEEDVFDFTAEGFHTALVGTGVVVHNCNTTAYFQANELGQLDLTVCNRSNDLVWGAYGANAVHFSVLLEFMAAASGLGLGRYWQFSANTHVYERHFGLVEEMASVTDSYFPGGYVRIVSPYEFGKARTTQLVSVNCETWLADLDRFMRGDVVGYRDPFFVYVAVPMSMAYAEFRKKDNPRRFDRARLFLQNMPPKLDWRVACEEWLCRREAK